MSNQRWIEPLWSAAGGGSALTASTTPTSLLANAPKPTLPGPFFEYVDGKTLKLRAAGRISNVVTTPGTLTLDLRFGSIVVWTSGAMALNVVAQTNVNWLLDVDLIIQTVGISTAATLLGQGYWKSHSVVGSPAPTAGGAGCHLLPFNTAPVAGNGFDSNQPQAIDLFGTWSINNANSIQLHSGSLLSIN